MNQMNLFENVSYRNIHCSLYYVLQRVNVSQFLIINKKPKVKSPWIATVLGKFL